MSQMPNGNPLPPEGVNAPRGTGLSEFARLVVGLVAVVVLLTAGLALGARWLAPLIPFQWERALVTSFEPEQTLDNRQAQRALDQLGDALASEADLPDGMALDFHLVPADQPNAFATLGGQIMVTRGLLDHVESENGLAMVLAHEIVHIRERHPIKSMSRGAVISLALVAISGATGERAINQVLGSAGLMTALSFNRAMERAADTGAIEILRRHYGHTRGAAEFFESMAAEEGSAAWTELLRTHPRSEERLRKLTAQRRKGGGELTPLPDALRDL